MMEQSDTGGDLPPAHPMVADDNPAHGEGGGPVVKEMMISGSYKSLSYMVLRENGQVCVYTCIHIHICICVYIYTNIVKSESSQTRLVSDSFLIVAS